MGIVRKLSSVLVIGLLVAGSGLGQEKKIKRSDLPPAVEKTVAEVSKNATIKGFNEEKEDGKTTYEVEMIVNAHTKDVQIDPSGTITEVEEEIPMKSLPTDVRAGSLQKPAPAKS